MFRLLPLSYRRWRWESSGGRSFDNKTTLTQCVFLASRSPFFACRKPTAPAIAITTHAHLHVL